MLQQIRHLSHNQIDKKKWDCVISESFDNRPYALSWYLDMVSPNWEALMVGDYEIIMPLTLKQKFGITYLVQPFQTQQLGIFSTKPFDKCIIEYFTLTINRLYFYIHIQLNASNDIGVLPSAPNYVLQINDPFNELFHSFSENHRRNFKKLGHTLLKSIIDYRQTAHIYDFLLHQEIDYYTRPQLMKVLKYTDEIYRRGCGCWQVALNNENEIVASIFWFFYKNRHIYYFSYASNEGKKQLATFYLLFEYLKHCESSTIIDFEGSKIDGIARFFAGFGAKAEFYPILKHFSLSNPFNKLIKLIR